MTEDLKVLLSDLAFELSKRRHERDQYFFDVVKDAVAGQKDAVTKIKNFANSRKKRLSQNTIPNAVLVDMKNAYPQIAAAVALAYVGSRAKREVEKFILAENTPMIRNEMLKEIALLQQLWFDDVLRRISAKKIPFTSPAADMYLRQSASESSNEIKRIKTEPKPLISNALQKNIDDSLHRLVNWLAKRNKQNK